MKKCYLVITPGTVREPPYLYRLGPDVDRRSLNSRLSVFFYMHLQIGEYIIITEPRRGYRYLGECTRKEEGRSFYRIQLNGESLDFYWFSETILFMFGGPPDKLYIRKRKKRKGVKLW